MCIIRPRFEQFNLQDWERLDALFQSSGAVDAVIHFAASKSVGESVRKPIAYCRNNLVSLLNLLEAMRAFGTASIVFSSSCTVYGQPEKLPVTEEAPFQRAVSPYGNTKRICEEILQDAIAAEDFLRGIALRYFNPIGAHPSALIGELPSGVPDNLVPYITDRLRAERSGSQLPRPEFLQELTPGNDGNRRMDATRALLE